MIYSVDMLQETKNRIDEVIAALKVGNSLFPDHIYLFDPFVDNPSGFQGLTDTIADYIYIYRAPFDEQLVRDDFTPTNYWARSIWVLVGRSSTYPKSEFVEFVINKIQRVGGCNVTNLAFDSERIYLEETEHELANSDMNLIRVTFTVASIVSWCPKTFELCLNGEC